MIILSGVRGVCSTLEKEAFFSMTTAEYLSRLLKVLPRPVDFPVIAESGAWEVRYEVALPGTFTLGKER